MIQMKSERLTCGFCEKLVKGSSPYEYSQHLFEAGYIFRIQVQKADA